MYSSSHSTLVDGVRHTGEVLLTDDRKVTIRLAPDDAPTGPDAINLENISADRAYQLYCQLKSVIRYTHPHASDDDLEDDD